MQNTIESTEEITIVNPYPGVILGISAKPANVYPYVFNGTHARKGQRCRVLKFGDNSTYVQVEFEGGGQLIVDKMNLRSSNKKKYSEKRGRPARSQSTLAPKQQIDQGE